MNNPNPNYNNGSAAAAGAIDPLFDPNFDLMKWIMAMDFLPKALVIRRDEFVEWAGAAGFENIEMRHLSESDRWEFRCRRGTNAECTSAADVERWLGFVARGSLCQIVQGQFIALVDGDSIAARFQLEPRK